MSIHVDAFDEGGTEVRVTGFICEGRISCSGDLTAAGVCSFPQHYGGSVDVRPEREGSCTVEIVSPHATIREEVIFRRSYGCCGGIRSEPREYRILRDAGTAG